MYAGKAGHYLSGVPNLTLLAGKARAYLRKTAHSNQQLLGFHEKNISLTNTLAYSVQLSGTKLERVL
jgi:hypothetical protein